MYGGLSGVRDLSLVQSALGRPYSGYYRAIHQKAAALVDSMSKNHGFVDGNKRTTLLLLHTFVVRSGYSIVPLSGEDLNKSVEDMILDVVTREMTVEGASDWFKARLRRR